MPLIDEPLYTLEIPTHEFTVPVGSSFLYSHQADEDRATPSPNWFTSIDPDEIDTRTVEVDEDENLIVHPPNGIPTVISLYDAPRLAEFIESLPQPVYLDITGLSHRTWAPLVRATAQAVADVRVIYLEPAEYLRRTFVDAQRIYDLSEKFDGLRPLPGFTVIEPEADSGREHYFVPMVGFEGSRLEYVLSQSEADLTRTYPVIGVPGFRPDYAFYAYQGNRRSFEREFLHRRVQAAKANCPFEAFYLLREIQSWSQDPYMRVAPIGTKPHALGAVLFALANPHQVELVYDNPVRARDRTEGQARVLVYALSAFIAGTQFRSAAA